MAICVGRDVCEYGRMMGDDTESAELENLVLPVDHRAALASWATLAVWREDSLASRLLRPTGTS